MRVIATRTLNAYRNSYTDADEALCAWLSLMKTHRFRHFAELRQVFSSSDLISDGRVVFNIKGNHFRLIADIDFQRQAVFIKWFGRHKEYEKIDPLEVRHAHPSR